MECRAAAEAASNDNAADAAASWNLVEDQNQDHVFHWLFECLYFAIRDRVGDEQADSAWVNEEQSQCHIFRDIFVNPFRPVAVDPSWLTTKVKKLAHAIYHDRAFDRLPALADALVEAGGTNPDILKHCRQAGEHVRGCWVVDLLLRKE